MRARYKSGIKAPSPSERSAMVAFCHGVLMWRGRSIPWSVGIGCPFVMAPAITLSSCRMVLELSAEPDRACMQGSADSTSSVDEMAR